jgi:hypothetical protein
VLLSWFVVAGCASLPGGDGARQATTTWVRDSGSGISVSHPAAWRTARFPEAGSFTVGLLFLFNQPVRPPCVTSSNAVGLRISCAGLPRGNLRPGGILIGWFSNGGGVPKGYQVLDHTTGRVVRIDDRPAKISSTAAAGSCRRAGGTVSIRATIAVGSGESDVTMDACLDRPTPGQRAQVLRSLRSVHT